MKDVTPAIADVDDLPTVIVPVGDLTSGETPASQAAAPSTQIRSQKPRPGSLRSSYTRRRCG